jgi:membrane-associated protein
MENSFFGIDLVSLILAAGYGGLFAIVFAESGLFLGFFLPGDSLLFTAGFLASRGYLNIWVLCVVSVLGAVLGDSFGYGFGKKTGPRIFRRENSFLFRRENLERARIFYERYGGRAIVLARFMPVIRTFAPILAGVGRMRYGSFLFYNVVGGLLFGAGVPLAGYSLGNAVPGVDRYILPIIGGIIFVSVLPGLIHFLRNKNFREALFDSLGRKRFF